MAVMASLAITEFVLKVDVTTHFSGTALQRAIAHGPDDTKHKIVRLLLQHDANINAIAGESGTVLVTAIVAKDHLLIEGSPLHCRRKGYARQKGRL